MTIIFFYRKTHVRVRGGIVDCNWSLQGVSLRKIDNSLSALHISQKLEVLVTETFAPQI
jgi:hypothetical protein